MLLRDHIKQTLAEVVAAFDDAEVYQAEVQFDVDVKTSRTLSGGDALTECESRGVRITVIIGRNQGATDGQ